MEDIRLSKDVLAETVVEAATYVLRDILSYPPTRGQMQITPIQYTRDDVTVVTRMSGDLTGELFFGLAHPVACGIVSQMLKRDVEALGRVETSALSELGSIITDSALAILEEQGALCYSSCSCVLVGREQRATLFGLPSLAVPLRLVVGEMNLNVLLAGYAPFAWASPDWRTGASSTIRVPATARTGRRESLPLAA